jgi:hypothetical protein
MSESGPAAPSASLKGFSEHDLGRPLAAAAAAALLGLAFDLFFDQRPIGISLLLFALLAMLALFGLAVLEGRRPSWSARWLALGLSFFAGMVAVRREPMSVFLDAVLFLGLLALTVRVFRSGGLARFGWIDQALALAWVPVEAVLRPWPVLGTVQHRLAMDRGGRGRLMAVIRGLLLGLPVLVVFGLLLSAADIIFADALRQALSWLDLERLLDWGRRLVIILVVGVYLLGGLAAALRSPGQRRLIGEESPLVKSFLGLTESGIVLGALDALFAGFVFVQFAYLFGGQANISATGYTYAQYARRGFGELVAAAFLALGLIVVLGSVTSRPGRQATIAFNALCSILILEVGVTLASALMRLLLYEDAYGFTRLRAYTHVAILWIGILFAAYLVLLLRGRLRRFALATLMGTIGFAATLNLINVDGLIVRQNAGRLAASGEIDVAYLSQLSLDAIPDLARLAMAAPADVRAELLPELACRKAQLEAGAKDLGWPSFHFGQAAALQVLSRIEPALGPYVVVHTLNHGWEVLYRGEASSCSLQPWAPIGG